MAREDEPFGASTELLAVEPAGTHRLHGGKPFVALDLDDVGVGVEVDVGRADDLAPIPLPEPRRRTKLPHPRIGEMRIGEERDALGVAVLPVSGRVLVGAELENVLRAGVERIEIRVMGQPLCGTQSRFSKSIDSYGEHHPAQCPVVPPKKWSAAALERIIRLADDVAAIELLHLGIEIEPAAIEDQDFEVGTGELAGDGGNCN